MFNFTQKWNFPSNNYGQILGIAESGVETFNGTPIKSLAREICQNSLDAALDRGKPTRIEFKTFEIDPHNIPDYKSLEDALKRALDFWSQQQSDKAKKFFRQALDVIHKPTITCLRISDFNTSGLIGSHEEYNSPWCNLTKSSGASDKSGSRGGSFGIGKFAPYACSSLRTVFYSTSDKDGVCASQGISRLTSFKNKKDEITQGMGFYGNDKNSPMYKQFSLDPAYSRASENSGTDIFVVAFNGDNGWQHQMVASILDGFLYAVYNETLVVDVDGTIISKDSLAELMVTHNCIPTSNLIPCASQKLLISFMVLKFGLLLPDSHLLTVANDTPSASANSIWLIKHLWRIALISLLKLIYSTSTAAIYHKYNISISFLQEDLSVTGWALLAISLRD